MRKRTSILAGLALAAVIASPVAAADVAESITVNGTLTVTGIPASINYGALDAGTTSADQTINYTVTANGNYVVTITGTAFARSGGGATMPASARQGWSTTASSGAHCTPLETWTAFNGTAQTCDGPMGSTSSFTTKVRVAVPGGQMAGTYTGTLTIAAAIP